MRRLHVGTLCLGVGAWVLACGGPAGDRASGHGLGSSGGSGGGTSGNEAGDDAGVGRDASGLPAVDAGAPADSGGPTPSEASPGDSGGPPAATVAIGSFGAVGTGGDDTAVFVAAMSGAASSGKVLEVTPGHYELGAIVPPSNLQMKLDANVCIEQYGTFGSSDVWVDLRNAGVRITGAGGAAQCSPSSSVLMATAGYDQSVADGSQYRHCLRFSGTNVTVSGIGCNQSGGDGMYVVNPASGITVQNCVFDHHIRNGGSGISGQHVTIDGCTFSNQTDFARSGIADGFDFEPNGATDLLVDWSLTGDVATGNQYDGIGFSLYALTDPSQSTTIALTSVASNDNDRYGFFVSNSGTTNSGGTISLGKCSADDNGNENAIARFWEANGPALTFQSFTSTRNNRLGGDVYGIVAGVAIGGGGGSSSASGNAHFLGTNVSASAGGYDFVFGDDSGHGLANVDFTGGTLSGGKAGCNGLVSGTCEASVHIP